MPQEPREKGGRRREEGGEKREKRREREEEEWREDGGKREEEHIEVIEYQIVYIIILNGIRSKHGLINNHQKKIFYN